MCQIIQEGFFLHYALLKAIMEKYKNREVNAVRRYLIGMTAALVIAGVAWGIVNMEKYRTPISTAEETGQVVEGTCQAVEETEPFLQIPETLPKERMRFLPSFCFSSSFFFRVMSPP